MKRDILKITDKGKGWSVATKIASNGEWFAVLAMVRSMIKRHLDDKNCVCPTCMELAVIANRLPSFEETPEKETAH